MLESLGLVALKSGEYSLKVTERLTSWDVAIGF